MKAIVFLMSAIGVVALAASLGSRIPPDVVAMGVGVVLGALAAIPVSLLMGAVLARRQQKGEAPAEQPARSYPVQPSYQPAYQPVDGYPSVRNFPPVVIINPASFQGAGGPSYAPARVDPVSLMAGQRQFRIIGDEAT